MGRAGGGGVMTPRLAAGSGRPAAVGGRGEASAAGGVRGGGGRGVGERRTTGVGWAAGAVQ